MSAHLNNGKVNIGQLQELARNKLLSLLGKCDSSKALMWDETLAGPVGLITEYRLLMEHNVKNMFPLKPNFIPRVDEKNVVFIVRPSLALMDLVADYIHGIFKEDRNKSKVKKEFHIFFVPHRSLLCEKRLMNKGVFGNCTIEEFNCELFPFDYDLLSMEAEFAFKEIALGNDPTCLYEVSRSLMTIQKEFGVIPQVSGKGNAAKIVWNLMNKMLREQTSKGDKKVYNTLSQIDHLLLIDRNVDLITPLATQLTYEGLIDELFGIHNTTAQFPSERFMKSENETPEALTTNKKQIILNSSDDLFADIRDKHFNAVGHILSKKAKNISAFYDLKPGESVEQMSQFVMQLPQLKSSKNLLAIHTTIAELIKEKTDTTEFLDSLQIEQELLSGVETDKVHPFIEDCIAKKQPLIRVLRLICLQSLANSGLKQKVLDYYKREITQTYGFQHVLTLNNLEKCGLLQHQSSRSYTVLRKTFRLIVEDGSEVEPADISYVHSVYAPISIRLAQHLVKPGGWKSIQDVLTVLPGPTVEGTQVVPSGLMKRGSKTSLYSQCQSDNPRVVLVFFIGGCTFAEISALRFLSQQEECKCLFSNDVLSVKKSVGPLGSFIDSITQAKNLAQVENYIFCIL